MTTKTKEEIPEKFKNNCPLDHSTYGKFISCDCNWGSGVEVWYFKEQTIQQQKEEIEKLLIRLMVLEDVSETIFKGLEKEISTVPTSFPHKNLKFYFDRYKVRAREIFK